jgi:hypothetical protein
LVVAAGVGLLAARVGLLAVEVAVGAAGAARVVAGVVLDVLDDPLASAAMMTARTVMPPIVAKQPFIAHPCSPRAS